MRKKILRLAFALVAVSAASANTAEARDYNCPGPLYIPPPSAAGSCLALGGPDCGHCKYDCEDGQHIWDMCET